jgi:hypothetical protein
MGLTKLVARKLPDPQEADQRPIAEQLLDTPLLIPVRLFWNNLLEFRPWWPVLIPLLLYVGWRSYQKERHAIKAR